MPAFQPELLLPRLAPFADARIAWIAFSGGMDSAVLLHALVEIRERLAFEIRALHVDHGLHPDSHAWSEQCARTCERLGVSLEARRVALLGSPGESLEAVARRARYESMAGLLEKGDLLLSAHHRDDQAETLLLALMRGSGPAGLAAMPLVAPLGDGRLVRPLLEQSRAELLDYAKSRSLSWLEDPSNRDLGFDRNFLRHRVLPLLRERWPSCATSLARSAAHCGEAQGIIDSFTDTELAKVAGQRPGTLSIYRLKSLPPPLRKATLRHWFRKRALAPPDSRHLGRILSEVMTTRRDANPLVAWSGCEVRRYRDDLFAMAPLPPSPGRETRHWIRGDLSLPSGLGLLKLVGLDAQRLDPMDLSREGLDVRFGVAGLSCRAGRGQHRRALKKLFQEAGVPPWIRPYIPLLFAEDLLVAVGDLWVCDHTEPAGGRQFRVRWESDLRRQLPLDSLRS